MDPMALTKAQARRQYRKKVTVDDLPAFIWDAHGATKVTVPENSIVGVEESIALGYDLIDLDALLTRDGVPVAMHDTTVDRTTDGTGPVTNYNLAQIRSLRATKILGSVYAHVGVPSIPEVLIRFGDRACFTVEAKDAATATPLIALVKELGLERSVFLNTKDLNVAQSITDAGLMAHVYGQHFALTDIDALRDVGCKLHDIFYSEAAPGVLAASVAEPSWLTLASIIDRRYEITGLIEAGVDGIVSNDPIYLQKRNSPPPASSIAGAVASGVPGHGWYTEAVGRPAIIKGTGIEFVAEATAFLIGDMSGTHPGSYTFDLSGVWTVAPNPTDRYMVLHFACPEDRRFNGVTPSAGPDGASLGYSAYIRYNGSMELYRDDAGSSTRIGILATAALTVGGVYQLRVAVTPTQITVTRVDTAQSFSVTDSAYRGGNVYLGRGRVSGTVRATAFTRT